MASTPRPLLLPAAAASRLSGVGAPQYSLRIGSKVQSGSSQLGRLAISGTHSSWRSARICLIYPATPSNSRAFSAVASSAGPTDDNSVIILPEPRRPHKHEGISAHKPVWMSSFYQSPQAYYEPDEYAGGVRVRSALLSSGPDAALHAYLSQPEGTVLLSVSTIDHFIRALLIPNGGSPFAPPPSGNISSEAVILIDQLRAHLRRPFALPPGFRSVMFLAMRVLAALTTSAAVPRRWEHVHTILDLICSGRLPVHSGYPSGIPVAAACYTSGSHSSAIAALSSDTRLSLHDWKAAIGIMGRIRFDARSFMSAEEFSRLLQAYEVRGGVVGAGLFISYVRALTIIVACLRQPEEERALNERGTNRRLMFRSIRGSLHMLEHKVLARYPGVSRATVCLPLFYIYQRLPHRAGDISRCWNAIMHSHPRLRSEAASLLVAFPPDTVFRQWEDLLCSDSFNPTTSDWCAFAIALQRGGAYVELVRALVRRIRDDPALLDAEPTEESFNALLKRVPLPAERARRVLCYLRRARGREPLLFPMIMHILRPGRQ